MRIAEGSARRRFGLAVVTTGVVASLLSGCSAMSPATAVKPYDPANGVGATISDSQTDQLLFRDILMVMPSSGASGTLLGTVFNKTDTPVTVTFTVLDAAGQTPLGTETAAVAANDSVVLGTPETLVIFPSVNAAPGQVLKLRADTALGGTTMSLNVRPRTLEYEQVPTSK